MPLLAALAIVAPAVASAGTVTNSRTGVPYTTLASAITGAIANDILVVDGALAENVTVDRNLTIVGNPGASITSGATQIFSVNAGISLTVDGLLIDGTSNTQGIRALNGGSTIVVQNSTFSTGTVVANAHGGGIEAVNPALVMLENVVFDGAPGQVWAALGGAVYVSNATGEIPVLLTDVVFDNLKTTNNGGALWGSNVDLVCTNCSFDHVIGGFGGSINTNGGHLTVERSAFCGGQGSLGGSVFSTAVVDLRSTVFVETRATSNGGAIFANGGTWTIENNHFLGVIGPNVVRIPVLATLASFENNLLMSNAGTKAVDVSLNLGATAPVYYNWFYNNGGNVSGFVLDPTNITAGGDPQIVAWSQDSNCTNDQLWPDLASPLIDAGDPAMFDLDGSRSDIGAFGGESADPFYFIDHDGDGVIYLYDCDDDNPDVFAGSPEFCDGIDNDCDGSTDEDAVDVDTFYEDCDLDGQGRTTASFVQCFPPASPPACGGVYLSFQDIGLLAHTDCDDTDPTVFLGAPELCAPGDQNCDGDPDQGAVDMQTWYVDGDGDGFGFDPILDCSLTPPPGTSAVDTDCDDTDANVFPGALDTCGDGIDQDCDGIDGSISGLIDWYPDADGDGFGDANAAPVADCRPGAGLGYVADNSDCDDADPAINPGAAETCDGVDQNCDGTIDNTGAPTTWYLDADGDGFGDDLVAVSADCQPDGYVGIAGDCDDLDPSVNPAATEVCDGRDEDCDGTIDDAGAVSDWFADADADTFGDPLVSVSAACVPGGFVADDTDCDDTSAAVFPGALETCNGIDDDCNGLVDDTGPEIAWYADADGDGYGDPLVSITTACPPDQGYVTNALDCDDADPTVNPAAAEVCDGIDQDCDGTIDNTGAQLTWYADADADTYGDPVSTVVADCQPAGYTSDASDCDDADASIHPGATEICDGVDEDCDGTIDNTGAQLTWFADSDGDTYGDTSKPLVADCQPAGYVADGTDCDDTLSRVYPGAPETCDGVDEDCDGTVDNTADPAIWFVDADADGFGDPATTISADCQPDGFVSDDTDCDDANPAVNPAATEVCDGVDDDCDGTVDNTGAPVTWYADADADGFGDGSAPTDADCQPAGYVPDASDCDDSDAAVHPGATEVCDGIDQDCDGTVDNTGNPSPWYTDADADGYGDLASAVVADCQPVGTVSDATDCDDSDAGIHPGAPEVCDGIDQDCDGTIDNTGAPSTWYADTDADGFGDPAAAIDADCQPVGTVVDATDCDDADAAVHPGATEQCNGIDDDCDGLVDNGGQPSWWFADADADGYGDPALGTSASCQPAGTVADDTDCDDSDDSVHPGAAEQCDGIDQDCDGVIDNTGSPTPWYTDADGDGYGDPATATDADCQPAGTVADGNDCDDADPGVNPGADEVCNLVDDDCDGTIDNTGAAVTWHADADADGFGDPLSSVVADCLPEGYTVDDTDCNDDDASVFPGAAEVCNGVDDDCDGAIDDAGPVVTWYADTDADGFGDPASTVAASCQPAGYVADGTDCNDCVATTYPGALETCNGVDDDCDGTVDDTGPEANWYADADGDGFGDPFTSITTACPPGEGWVTNAEDCDDADAGRFPGATEVCDGIDQDCDGAVDDTGPEATWYADADADGFGDPGASIATACPPGAGYVDNADDCDDADSGVFPGAPETCDGVDEDCNGVIDDTGAPVTWHADVDCDGFGDPLNTVSTTCGPPAGYTADASDCDDSDATVHPGATETCDGDDEDCDGQVDEVVPTATYYTDSDHDTYGNSATAVVTGCPAAGAVTVGGDCNDASAGVHPNAVEVRNSIDDDCDGQIDEGTKPEYCDTCNGPHPWWYLWCWPALKALFGC